VALPEVPTMAEAGYPGCEFYGTMVLLGPAGLPEAIVSLLSREIAAILEEPEVRAFYATTGADPVYGTPEQTRAFVAREAKLSGALIKALHIEPE
jgi:tripartite-type tricarboxylate transporter receptor subunit TctC